MMIVAGSKHTKTTAAAAADDPIVTENDIDRIQKYYKETVMDKSMEW